MSEDRRVTVETFRRKKAAGERLTMLTAYDYPFARLAEEAGVDAILVGDSLGMAVLGYDSTLPVTMADMLHHTAAVVRGAKRPLVIADLPFLSYQASADEALRNGGRFLQEAGAAAVKLEGGREVAPTVRRLVAAGIPVMGHLGLTPQSINQFGGYSLQANQAPAALALLEDAQALAAAGAFAVVLEKVPWEVAENVTTRLPIPTIGIGCGPACDGQVLVLHDMLGLFTAFKPRFVKQYAQLAVEAKAAIGQYVDEVRQGTFPAEEHAWRMEPAERRAFENELARKELGLDDSHPDDR